MGFEAEFEGKLSESADWELGKQRHQGSEEGFFGMLIAGMVWALAEGLAGGSALGQRWVRRPLTNCLLLRCLWVARGWCCKWQVV